MRTPCSTFSDFRTSSPSKRSLLVVVQVTPPPWSASATVETGGSRFSFSLLFFALGLSLFCAGSTKSSSLVKIEIGTGDYTASLTALVLQEQAETGPSADAQRDNTNDDNDCMLLATTTITTTSSTLVSSTTSDNETDYDINPTADDSHDAASPTIATHDRLSETATNHCNHETSDILQSTGAFTDGSALSVSVYG
ncbi:hypothetical protein M407DRAFT_20079 [Tulasnella calospora MUT 4182]|uniref:Uncharacterized protein n=1 Tax=Tulasnella calospora MUT 4182 TaxID=1051891 RepID=A0A0C3QGV9_9AGAM|nr:hypothetical protein M407DRAFT_20079 [Tulasnella calospora MUT 4182]